MAHGHSSISVCVGKGQGHGLPHHVWFLVCRRFFPSPLPYLRIFNAGLKLDELPRSWAHFALTLEPVNPPVLVTQIQMVPGEWLYIASLLPQPYTSLEEEGLPALQVWFIVLSSIFLLLFIGLLVHWQSRPLKRLARAARDMSLGAEEVKPVEIGGVR